MILYLTFFLALGLVFGSFANVCISRIPKGESVVFPKSHCPKCNKLIKWYDNLPLLSYVILKAKCRACGEPISIQYPLVELITGCSFLALALNIKDPALLAFYLLLTLVLIIISGIDFHVQIIPDSLSLPLIAAGLLVSPFNNSLGSGVVHRILNSFLGVLAGGGSLFLLGFFGEKIMKKEAMGGGDVKLLAGIGAVIGWSKIFSVLFVASLVGSVFGILLIMAKKIERTGYIPFGPFIAVSAYINLFLPDLARLIFAR